MNEIFEPALSMPVIGELVEANGFFGGVATASQVNIWHSLPYWP